MGSKATPAPAASARLGLPRRGSASWGCRSSWEEFRQGLKTKSKPSARMAARSFSASTNFSTCSNVTQSGVLQPAFLLSQPLLCNILSAQRLLQTSSRLASRFHHSLHSNWDTPCLACVRKHPVQHDRTFASLGDHTASAALGSETLAWCRWREASMGRNISIVEWSLSIKAAVPSTSCCNTAVFARLTPSKTQNASLQSCQCAS